MHRETECWCTLYLDGEDPARIRPYLLTPTTPPPVFRSPRSASPAPSDVDLQDDGAPPVRPRIRLQSPIECELSGVVSPTSSGDEVTDPVMNSSLITDAAEDAAHAAAARIIAGKYRQRDNHR